MAPVLLNCFMFCFAVLRGGRAQWRYHASACHMSLPGLLSLASALNWIQMYSFRHFRFLRGSAQKLPICRLVLSDQVSCLQCADTGQCILLDCAASTTVRSKGWCGCHRFASVILRWLSLDVQLGLKRSVAAMRLCSCCLVLWLANCQCAACQEKFVARARSGLMF